MLRKWAFSLLSSGRCSPFSSSFPVSLRPPPSLSTFSRPLLSTSSFSFSKKQQEVFQQQLEKEIDWEEGEWGVQEVEKEKGEGELVKDMKEAEKENLERKNQFLGVKEVVEYLRDIRVCFFLLIWFGLVWFAIDCEWFWKTFQRQLLLSPFFRHKILL